MTAQGGLVALSEMDVFTGQKAARPGYQRVKEAAREGLIDAIVVWKLDRFGRNFREWLNTVYELEQEIGVKVESITDSNDPLTRNILMSVAEQFLRDLSAHTTNGLRRRAEKGEWSGMPPVGYKVQRLDGISRLVPDPLKAELVARLFRDAATGRYSLGQLADMATSWGLVGRENAPIPRPAFGRILRNPTYRGAVVYGRKSHSVFKRRGRQPAESWIVAENAHPALVDRATFDAVQAALTRHRTEQGTVRRTKHLLTSLVYCGQCGRRMYGHGSKTPVYECSMRRMYGSCSARAVWAPTLEAVVKACVVETFTVPPEVRAKAIEYIRAELNERRTAGQLQRRNLERELRKHRDERVRLAREFMTKRGRAVPLEVYQQLEADEALAIATLERTLASMPVEPAVSDIRPVLDAVAAVEWDDFTDWEDWRELLVLLVDRIDVREGAEAHVEWRPQADILKRALSKASRFGS